MKCRGCTHQTECQRSADPYRAVKATFPIRPILAPALAKDFPQFRALLIQKIARAIEDDCLRRRRTR